MTERADDIATAFLQHLQKMAKHSNNAAKQAVVSTNREICPICMSA